MVARKTYGLIIPDRLDYAATGLKPNIRNPVNHITLPLIPSHQGRGEQKPQSRPPIKKPAAPSPLAGEGWGEGY